MTILEKLLDAVDEIGHGLVENGRDDPEYMILPEFIGMSQEGKLVVVVAPWQSNAEKRASLIEIRKLFRENNVIAYATLSEAWVRIIDPKSEEGQRVQRGEGPDVMPSESPDRREVVIVTATDNTKVVSRCYALNRDARGCMTGITKEKDTASPDVEIRGRMLNLLSA